MRKILILSTFIIANLSIGQNEKAKDSIKNKLKIFGSFEHNGQWYVNDKNREIGKEDFDSIPLRSNNYLNVNLNYGRFTAGTQIESYTNEALLNYNPKYRKTDFGTYYVNYKSKKLDITAGHYYVQFGNGTSLRAWEDRSLGINNALMGLKIDYSPFEAVSFTGLYGRQRSGFDLSNGKIYGFDSRFNLSNLFSISNITLNYGFSIVNRYEKIDYNNPTSFNTNVQDGTLVYSNRFDISYSNFYLNFEQDIKSEDAIFVPSSNKVNYEFSKPGSAYLLNFGYSKKGFGIDATLRRLENMLFLSERTPEVLGVERTTLFYNDMLMNYIPGLTKQHHSNLANIYVYQAQSSVIVDPTSDMYKSGEIGGQIDLFYDFKKGTTLGGKYGTKLSLNFSSWYNLKAKYQVTDSDGNFKPDYKTEFFGSSQKYFSDYNIEISKKFSPSFTSSLVYINQFYNNRYIQAANILINSNILFSESTIKLGKNKSITVGLEHLWADKDRKNWAGGSIEYNHNEHFSMFIMDLYNYGFDKSENLISKNVDEFDIHFYNFGAAYKLGSARIALNYGRQRGGLVCAGGVCRFVPPSTGLGLQITKTF